MASKIVSISLTDQEREWLDTMEISPTALMKQKISEMMTASLSQRKRIKELESAVENCMKNIEKMAKFMDSKGLYDEYLRYQNGFN